MGSKRGKQILFTADQFIIMVAWIVALLAILYLGAYYFVVPIIVAFIALNLSLGLWINRFIHPIENKRYRQYLTVQTLFWFVWCPLLAIILSTRKTDLIPVWVAVLIAFYFALGVLSYRKILTETSPRKVTLR